jgi:PAS domain S-box-containing protein
MKPVVPSPAGGIDALPRPPPPEATPVQVVLVVEDNPITRRLLRVTLELGEYDVLDAGDAREALALVATRRPDLLILDFVLPDMDGLELLAALRARLKWDVPAIVVTGMVSRLDSLRSRSSASLHFLPKPVEPSTLLAAVRAELARQARPPAGRRVLVVDDEASNRKLASVRLEEAGYEVEVVSSGHEALMAARRRPPDAILSDVMMPSMDGFSFCREVRRDPALSAVPVILLSSSYVEAADRDLAQRVGAHALVVRTPDLADAAAAVAEALRTRPGSPPAVDSSVIALHRERLQVQLERQTSRNEMLLRQAAIQATALSLMRGLSEVMGRPADVPQLLGDVLAHCLDAGGLSTGLLYITQETGAHALQAQFGLPVGRKLDAEDFFGHPEIIRSIARDGVPVAFSAGAAGADAGTRDFLARIDQSSVLVLPFVVLGQSYGALLLASDDHDLTDAAWLGFARSLALQFGQTVALGQSLKRLAESESRYRALVEEASDAMFVLDVEGTILEANQQAESLLGSPRAAMVGRRIASFAPAAEAAAHAARFAATVAAGGGRQDTVTLLRADAALVDVDFAISVNAIDGRSSVLFIGRDVTQRNRDAATLRAAQVKLRESERQYRLLFDGNPHAMFVQDRETFAFLAVNDAMVRQYGYSRDEFRGMTTADIRAPEEVAAYRARYAESAGAHLNGGTYYSDRSFKHRRKDGTTIDVDIAASAIEFAGRPSWLILATDVTEKEVLQAQLVEAQKMEAVGQLAGGVAHDFNNLLGVITGYSELLVRALAPESRECKRAEEIGHASDRAAALTRQLLAFSRRQVLQPRVLDLNGVVRTVETMLRRVISADIQIVTRVDPDLGRVRADAGQVEQVLMNLAINARDAMEGGGRLLVETRNVEESVVLAVSDTGHGMSAETMSRIFEPFFTTKEAGKGTGLGLATVYGIVRQSGGTVTVSSEPDRGTTFEVRLPRVDDEVEADTAQEHDPSPGGSETILVVEDADALRILVREILESVGYVVLDAASPDAALALLANTATPVALVLTDIVMPRMSGPALARQITALKPETRIVFMSGYADAALGEEGTLAPGAPFLQKPFSTDALLSVLRRTLDEAR